MSYCHFGVSPVNFSDAGIYFWGTGERRPNLEGSSGTKQYSGTGIIRFFFEFGGTEEHSNLFQGNKEIGTTLEGPLIPFK